MAAWRGGLSGVGVRGSRGMERVVGGIQWGTVLGTTSKLGVWWWGKHFFFLTRGFIKDKCFAAVVILTIKEGCRVCAEVYLKLQFSVGFVSYVNVCLRCKTGGLQERALLKGP